MGGSRRRRRRAIGKAPAPPRPPPREPPRQPSARDSNLRNLWRLFAKIIGHWWQLTIAISVIVAIVAGALFLFPPRVTVDSSGAFDASDPLSTSFVIKNTWVLPLRGVMPFVGHCEFRVTSHITLEGDCSTSRGSSRFVVPSWGSRNLDVDEKFSIALASVFNTPAGTFSGGDITIGVTFRPWIIPYPIERMFRFVAQKQRDGRFSWVPQALDGK
jgi:hypothetical protein